MLTPTHIQVGVIRTKELIYKGKNGTNDVFIIYSLGKEKYQSSVKENTSDSMITWNEGCDISIPKSNGNKSELVLKVMHRASMGDKFLGRVALPLSEFDVTAKVKPVWYPLKPKQGSEKDTKYRGEIEVRISFLIKSIPDNASTNDLSEKTKRSGSFKSSLGSILSLGKSKKKKKDKDQNGFKDSQNSFASDSTESLQSNTNGNSLSSSRMNLNNPLPIINDDPGVISEEEDENPFQFRVNRKKSVQSITESIKSTSISEKLNTPVTSVPSTPQNLQKSSGFSENTTDDDPASTKISDDKIKPAPVTWPKDDDQLDDNVDNSSPSPKPRTKRLPSVIVEEPPIIAQLSTSNNDTEESKDPPSPITTSHDYALTLPRTAKPPQKLTVSSSMSNLADAGNNGKGSVRKTIKSMFSSSKHMSVDEIFPPFPQNDKSNASVNSASTNPNNDTNTFQPQFPGGGFFMRRKESDLGIPKETLKQYDKKSKGELVAMIVNLQTTASTQKQKIADLEDYIDKLLLRVLDNMPGLLSKQSSIRSNKE